MASEVWLKPLVLQKETLSHKLHAINQQHARNLAKLNTQHARDLDALTADYIDVLDDPSRSAEFTEELDCMKPLIEMMPELIALMKADAAAAETAASTLDSMMNGTWFDFEGDADKSCC